MTADNAHYVKSETLFSTAPRWDLSAEWSARSVSRATAADWISRYHYLQRIGTARYTFGVFVGHSDAIAVVVLSGATGAYGPARYLGLEQIPGNIEISRVAVHPEAPKNAASRSVALVLKQIRECLGLQWVFSYADTGQGHHGGIYQALNAVYIGVDPGGEPPPLWEIKRDGKWMPIHSRSLVKMCGTARAGAPARMAALGQTIRIVAEHTPKHAYVLPCGTQSERWTIRRKLEPFAKPYPKRAVGVEETNGVTNAGMQVRCLPTAPISNGGESVS